MSIPPRQSPRRKPRRNPGWRDALEKILYSMRDDLALIVFGAVAGLVRAMGVKVETGWTGLLFTMGHAGKELHPGFHLLIPFVQRARKVPTRSRTLDLPLQRVVNADGLVFHVDANLVYRIVDVRKALIEIDRLEKGMLQMLGLGVGDILRAADHEAIKHQRVLDEALEANLSRRLEPWGVTIERVGFQSISPSPQTLRITQLAATIGERRETARLLAEAGIAPRRTLPLVGTRQMPRQRTRLLVARELYSRRRRHILALAKRAGWSGAEIRRARVRLRASLALEGRGRALQVT